MFRDHRKPWSRTDSICSARWSSCQVNPDPPPTPDPQPAPDDDDDQLQVWVGANNPTKHPSNELFIQALGNAGCGSTGECFAGLFAADSEYDDAYFIDSSPSGSVPPRIGRQMARPYRTSEGGQRFDVFMATPQHETVGGVSSKECFDQLYFAWLDDQQYGALCTDVDARSKYPQYDTANHKMLWFAEQPQFKISQPFAETWGSLRVMDRPTIRWKSIRVTLFGIVGESTGGTPRTWAWSQPAVEVESGLWKFGAPAAPQIVGTDGLYPASPVLEVFAVGWGMYEWHGEEHAAVTPPLCTGSYCYRPGIGDWHLAKPLADGLLTPFKWQEMIGGFKSKKDSSTSC